ncbi:MAG TPA: C-terminal binding protein [Candidatus Dormibacteraeota bacterium]
MSGAQAGGGLRVLITDHVFTDIETERSMLKPLGAEVELATAIDEQSLVGRARGAAAIIVCYAKLTEPVVLAAAEGGCRVIARYGIGYDNVDVAAATRAGLLVTNVPDYCLDEVADHTMALLLDMARGVTVAAAGVRAGSWAHPSVRIHRMDGRVLALIGTGRIGRRVASRAMAFGLRVVGFDPYLKAWDLPGVERVETLEAALETADFISLHAPMTAANHHLIGPATLAMVKRSPILINTARGGLVDLDAVIEALDDGRLGGVALDVTEVEPLSADHPLRHHPRALLTPHMAFYSEEAQRELQRRAAEEVVRALKGEDPRCPVNPEVLLRGARQ